MALLFRGVICLLCLSPLHHSQAAEPMVLITGFDAFAGRQVNGSATVARALASTQPSAAVATMPVIWGEPQRALPPLIAHHRPHLLLGLGEGHPGRIAVETVAHNRAAGKDVMGDNAPDHLGNLVELSRPARLTIDLDALPESPYPVLFSDDAGAYLCNAWLWQAAGSEVPMVGFIHLPPQGETSDAEYLAAILPVIEAIIAQILAASNR